MMESKLKSFNEMMEIDLKQYTQQKPTFYKDKQTGRLVPNPKEKWLDYIEWGMVVALLYKNGAQSVAFSSSFHESKPNTLTICLVIDQKKYWLDYPIIDGNTVINQPNQMQIHKAEMRGFVKAVAIYTGLGLKLWLKEEEKLQDIPVEDDKPKEPVKSDFKPDGYKKAIDAVLAGKMTAKAIIDAYNVTPEQVKQLNEAEKSAKGGNNE